MYRNINIFGKQVVLHLFININDHYTDRNSLADWKVNEFCKFLENNDRLSFHVEPNTPGREQTPIPINGAQYRNINGTFSIQDNGDPVLYVSAQKVDGSNYSYVNELTVSASQKLRAALVPILTEAYTDLETAKNEAHADFLATAGRYADYFEKRAQELRDITTAYATRDMAKTEKWRTEDGQYCRNQAQANLFAMDAKQPFYYKEVYRVRGNALIETIQIKAGLIA